MAQQRVGRYAAIGKNKVGGMRAALTHLAIGRADGESRCAGRNEERADTVGARAFLAGARHQGKQARFGRARNITLGSIRRITVGFTHRACAQRRRVGSGVGHGQSERRHHVT